MKKVLAIFLSSLLLPFLALAASPNLDQQPILVPNREIEAAKEMSKKAETSVISWGSGKAEFLPWVREKAKNTADYIDNFVRSMNATLEEKWRSFLKTSIAEGAKGIVSGAKDSVEKFIEYIKQKI